MSTITAQYRAILVLLVASYASSGISGVIVGPTADVFGRRLLCSLFGIFAVLSVVCLHNSHFGVLLLGRVFRYESSLTLHKQRHYIIRSGLSVSILYSCFEAWVASEFFNASLKSKDLAHTFAGKDGCSLATMLIHVVSGYILEWFCGRHGELNFTSPLRECRHRGCVCIKCALSPPEVRSRVL
jgi:MFS family permease